MNRPCRGQTAPNKVSAPRRFTPDAEISTGHNNNQQVLTETLAPAQGNCCGDQLFMCACIPLVWHTQPAALSQGCRGRAGDLHPPSGQIGSSLARNPKMGKAIDAGRRVAMSAAGVWCVLL